MHVVRVTDAPQYKAPGHDKMEMRRLQGLEAGPSDTFWIGISTILPGGETTSSASPMEKIYVVLEGEVLVSNGTDSVLLLAWDSCRIEPGEPRQLRNMSGNLASVLLVMPKNVRDAEP